MLARILILPALGCAVILSSDQSCSNDATSLGVQMTVANETASLPAGLTLTNLIAAAPDGGQIVAIYQSARTVTDLEAANEKVSNDVAKAQSIAAEISRLHRAVIMSCDGPEMSQVEAIADKARSLSGALFQVDAQLTKSLATLRKQTEARKPSITTWKSTEDVRRFELAAHRFGQLRVQAQEMAKTIDGLAVIIRTTAESCRPTPIPPLFAQGVEPSPKETGTPARASLRGQPKAKPLNLLPAWPQEYIRPTR